MPSGKYAFPVEVAHLPRTEKRGRFVEETHHHTTQPPPSTA
jgi:hypothetical protein